jgi:hypothetical protein
MKTGEKYSVNDLANKGWIFTGQYFGKCQIWKKGEEQILWNPDTQIVGFIG